MKLNKITQIENCLFNVAYWVVIAFIFFLSIGIALRMANMKEAYFLQEGISQEIVGFERDFALGALSILLFCLFKMIVDRYWKKLLDFVDTQQTKRMLRRKNELA